MRVSQRDVRGGHADAQCALAVRGTGDEYGGKHSANCAFHHQDSWS
jgi:hypothetical protein